MSVRPRSILLTAILASLGVGYANVASAVTNEVLVANKDVVKAQAAGAVITFMSKGAKECDADGNNCHSMFGANDSLDYSGAQSMGQSITGIDAFNFKGKDDDSNSIVAQTATLAIACGDTSLKQGAGIALKVTECAVTDTGDAQIKFKVCTAPSRQLPVSPPNNEVVCSNDPTAANYRPPPGKVCKKASCDTEPVGSLNGWSPDTTISFVANMPANASADDVAKNGLGMIFFPPLGGGVVPSMTADSDSLSAVKIVETYLNPATRKTAVGLRIAYRHKNVLTKAMMTQGLASVPNPGDQTAQWDSIVKLQANPLINQYAQKYGQNGSNCLQQISNGIAQTGEISVCDKDYVGLDKDGMPNGVKPIAKSAQIAVEGQECGSTETCLQEVVNTNTWTDSCRADVPLSMRNCSTTQDYSQNTVTATRTRPTEICHERRTNAIYTCSTETVIVGATPTQCPAGTQLVNSVNEHKISCGGPCNDPYLILRVTCLADNKLEIKWGTSANGSTYYWMLVDEVRTLNAFETVPWVNSTGPVCSEGWDGVTYNQFSISCTNSICTYAMRGQKGASYCFWALAQDPTPKSTSGQATINYDGIFSTINQCSTYEAAH